MINFKKFVKTASATGTVLLLSPLSVFAQAASEGDRTVKLTELKNPDFDGLADIRAQGVLVFIINGILMLSGLIAFLFLLWGGVQWILAGGDKEGTEKARKRITSALVGLAIVFSAYAIAFLVNAVFDVNILEFTIPTIVQQ
jgi:hypothetical protein